MSDTQDVLQDTQRDGLLRAAEIVKIPLNDGAVLERDSGMWFLVRGTCKLRKLDQFETEFAECAIRAAAESNAEGRNQCDGCARGLRIVNGNHITEYGQPVMACTADRYAPSAPTVQVPRDVLKRCREAMWAYAPVTAALSKSDDPLVRELDAILAAAKEPRK